MMLCFGLFIYDITGFLRGGSVENDPVRCGSVDGQISLRHHDLSVCDRLLLWESNCTSNHGLRDGKY